MGPQDIIVPIVLFLAITAVIITHLAARHKERLTMLDKGLGSEEIKAMYSHKFKHDPLTSLKWGILLVMGGLAVLAGETLHNMSFIRDEGPVIIGMIPLFLGIGLLIFYGIAAKRDSRS